MPKKKYIAIYNNEAHIFYSWPACKEFVGDKKNILYKGFLDPDEDEAAKKYMDANIKKNIPFDVQDVLYAYVDGSYRDVNGESYIGYGVSLVKNLTEIDSFYGRVENKNSESMNQVSGELYATYIALKEAIRKKEKRVIVVYDFIGIEAWINGSWKIKNDVVQKYVDQINQLRKKIAVDFVKVDSHVNKSEKKIEHILNDRADELAKMCWQNK